MSVLKKSTLSLLCAGLLMSSCSSQCGLVSLLGWIATGGGATITLLSGWLYNSSKKMLRQKREHKKKDHKNPVFGSSCDTCETFNEGLNKLIMKYGQYGMGIGACVTACGLYSIKKNWKKADV